jgi:hypothetical protein
LSSLIHKITKSSAIITDFRDSLTNTTKLTSKYYPMRLMNHN